MAKTSKERLLTEATNVFALHGYQGTTTRMIAKQADVNISAITYYFGGKEGLYQAILEDIVHRVNDDIKEALAESTAFLKSDDGTPEQAQKLLYRFILGFCKLLSSDKLSGAAVTIFMREYAEPTPVLDTLYQGLISPVYKIVTRLLAKSAGLPEESEEAALCTFPLLAQVFVFKIRKNTVTRHLKWKDYGPAEIKKITDMVTKHTQAVLDLYKTK